MRTLTTLLATLFLALGIAQANEVKWRKSYEGARAEAKSSGKLMMIDFYTDW